MAQVLDTLTGRIAEVPDEVAASQVAKSERVQLVSKGRVQVRTPLGERGDIALEYLGKAGQWGYQALPGAALEEERLQREYGNAPAKAFAEGALRGVTSACPTWPSRRRASWSRRRCASARSATQ